jgi:hypothetical protein
MDAERGIDRRELHALIDGATLDLQYCKPAWCSNPQSRLRESLHVTEQWRETVADAVLLHPCAAGPVG